MLQDERNDHSLFLGDQFDVPICSLSGAGWRQLLSVPQVLFVVSIDFDSVRNNDFRKILSVGTPWILCSIGVL